MEEIEIPTIVGNQGDTKAEEKKVEKKVRPVSIKTLFLRFSSKKELTGFPMYSPFCSLMPRRDCIWSVNSCFLHLLG